MCNSMIVNSNHPHTYKQYMAALTTPSESTTVFDTVFRRAGNSLNHCIQLTSLRGGYEKALRCLPHQSLAHHVLLDLRTQYQVGDPFSQTMVENM